MNPAITVFGTGAMGCWMAARLAAAGAARVTIVGTWAAGLAAIARDGIHVDEPQGSIAARPAVAHRDDLLGPADFALVLVKSPQTASIAPAAVRAVKPGGRVVTLQNGLGNREVLDAADGQGRVRAGVVVAGVRLTAPAAVSALPGTVTLEGKGDEPMERLCALMQQSGINARISADIEPELWLKLAVNCAINPLSALLRVPNGGLLQDPQASALMTTAALEVEAVAAARGIAIPGAVARAREIAARTSDNRSSMLQDLDRGAGTEIDALCGAVVREGARLGVPTPVNARLWRDVRALEARPHAAPGAVRG